jgi:hypothetical protein
MWSRGHWDTQFMLDTEGIQMSCIFYLLPPGTIVDLLLTRV